MSFDLVITNAGRTALVNAANTGTLPVTIAQIGVSATFTVPVPTLTALPAEIKRLSSIAGDVVANDTIHVTLRDESGDAYSLRTVALYLADGTLFAVAGQASPLITKTTSSIALAAFDITFADVAAASLTFGSTDFMLPAATTDIQGVVELATVAEAQAGTDTARALTPQSAKAAVVNWLSGVDLSVGRLEARTPNVGTTGGLRVRANQSSGTALVQITNQDAATQWGFWRHTAAGEADWHGSGGLRSGGALAWTAGNDGAGSGLDADTLDGQQGSWYADIAARLGFAPLPAANYTAADVLAKLLGLDGSGSGLDADMLDGRHANAFALLADFGFPAVGVFKLPGGFCIQWGSAAHADNSGIKGVAWNAPMNPFMALASNSASGPPSAFHGTGNFSTSGMTVYSARSTSVASLAGTAFNWIAIGLLI